MTKRPSLAARADTCREKDRLCSPLGLELPVRLALLNLIDELPFPLGWQREGILGVLGHERLIDKWQSGVSQSNPTRSSQCSLAQYLEERKRLPYNQSIAVERSDEPKPCSSSLIATDTSGSSYTGLKRETVDEQKSIGNGYLEVSTRDKDEQKPQVSQDGGGILVGANAPPCAEVGRRGVHPGKRSAVKRLVIWRHWNANKSK
ncbi:hypothetical protein EDC04DRAFT_2607198 [Pisolithus marmoratus]|nr:hypothetical protein EDC04DRAFT_2607198 [Pisolithus marmoratus]